MNRLTSWSIEVLGVAGILALLGTQPACTVALKESAEQCSSDADCAALGSELEDTFCNERSVCQLRTEHCETNAQCVERNLGGDFICRQSDARCVALKTAECPRVSASSPDDLKNDDTVVLGTIYFAQLVQTFADVETAFKKVQFDLFGSGTIGLPPTKPGGTPRPIVFVNCDVLPWDETKNFAALDHLIKEV